VIDPRAIIDPSAKIGENVTIGPWTLIGPDVEIGDGTWVGSHVVIKGPARIGKNNKIHQFASLGEAPQSINYAGEDTALEIGDENVIREFCTLNRGTLQGGGVTKVGNRNFFMSYVHIAHDCNVGNDIIFANNAALSGHVKVGDWAGFGGFSAVHQFCQIGAHAFVAGETSVPKDVLPFILVSGHPATAYGLNNVGLRRRGFDEPKISALRNAYNIIYRQGYTVAEAAANLEVLASEHNEIQLLIDALNTSTRGIVR
jgi:UDP-N-acetylglucosamine acyltransferase